MQVSDEAGIFAYEAGEEVVAIVAGVEALDLERCVPLPTACLPGWTIGDVVAREVRAGQPSYVLRFRHRNATCLAVVGQEAIEGTA